MSERGEKELTRFLQTELKEELQPKLQELGFSKPIIKRRFLGIELDVYSYTRRKGGYFAIWEIEILSGHHKTNVTKLSKILRLKWEPTVFMFHIFSPCYYSNEKEMCSKLAQKLEMKYPRRFIYEQIDIDIPNERFGRMLDYFQSSKYSAKQYYGIDLEREVRKIVNQTITALR